MSLIKQRRPDYDKKGWGREVLIANGSDYCGKLLEFNEGASFSMHYHLEKTETFYVLSGKLRLEYFNLDVADRISTIISAGDIVDIFPGAPHKLTALEESVIIEVSTEHFDSDSYRIEKGDSQK